MFVSFPFLGSSPLGAWSSDETRRDELTFLSLLSTQDPSFLFIIIRAKSVDVIQKAVLIAQATKRLRHTRWEEVEEGEEIRQ